MKNNTIFALLALTMLCAAPVMSWSHLPADPLFGDADKFAGSWTGVLTCFDQSYITVGVTKNSRNSIIVPATIGFGVCQRQTGVVVNVYLNQIRTLTTTVIDNCGNAFSLTIAGYVAENSIVIYYTENGYNGTIKCSFAGTR